MRWTALLLIALLSGCSFLFDSGSSDEPGEVTEEGVDITDNPLGVLGALTSLGSDLQNIQQELEEMPDVDPVHFKDLMAVLPEPLDGYTAEDPKGSTNQMGDMKISSVSRVYRADDGDARVEVEIKDWAFNKALYLPFVMQAKFSQETTEGWSKGITVGDDPGREQFDTTKNSGERTVLRNKRFPIRIQIKNLPPEAFDEWWRAVQFDELPE